MNTIYLLLGLILFVGTLVCADYFVAWRKRHQSRQSKEFQYVLYQPIPKSKILS